MSRATVYTETMSEDEKQRITEAVLNFDGWVVPSAEGEASAYDHDIEETKQFFGKFLTFTTPEDAPSGQAAPA
jgi:hypothetical protein